MIISIHQPGYFPWLGYLDKVNKSDIFIILDNVQFNDSAFQNRNLFLDNKANPHYLTIAVNKKNYLKKTIRDIKIADNKWQKKHYKFLFFNYKKHPYFDEIMDYISSIYFNKYIYLIDVLLDSMEILFKLFDIDTNIKIASNNINNNLKKEELVIEIVKKFSGNIYLSGQGAKVYQSEDNFQKKDIELVYQKFKHPIYKQLYSKKFIEGLSSLDLLFNEGIENSRKILKGI